MQLQDHIRGFSTLEMNCRPPKEEMQLCFSVDASAEVRSPGGYSPAAVDFTEESKQGQQRGRRALELLMVGEVYGCCNVEAYIAVGRWLREGSTAGGEPPSPLARCCCCCRRSLPLRRGGQPYLSTSQGTSRNVCERNLPMSVACVTSCE